MRFMASCLFGLEKPVCDDIAVLGYEKTEVMDGHVLFEAPESAIAECNVNFRYAERLFIVLGAFHAASFTELFDGTALLPWEKYITKNAAFPVKGHCVRSKLFSVPDCQRIIKKAVAPTLSLYIYNCLVESSQMAKANMPFSIFTNSGPYSIKAARIISVSEVVSKCTPRDSSSAFNSSVL